MKRRLHPIVVLQRCLFVLLPLAIVMGVLSVAIGSRTLRYVAFGIFGTAVAISFLPLVLSVFFELVERIKRK